MTGQPNWKVSYPLFMAAMAAIGGVSYLLLRWLERRPSGLEE